MAVGHATWQHPAVGLWARIDLPCTTCLCFIRHYALCRKKVVHQTTSTTFLGHSSTNALNINFFLLPTKFLQPVNLAVFLIWSLFNPLAVPSPHLLSLCLAHLPSPHWKSQIDHLNMHHPVSGINSLIHSVSLASHISTRLLIHLSAHLYYHHHSRHPSLLHSFTPGSKPTFSTNPSHLRLLLPTGLPSWQQDWTGPIMLIVLFLVSHFNFFVCSVW